MADRAPTSTAPVPTGTARGGDPVPMAREVLVALERLMCDADATFAPEWAWDERTTVIRVLDRIGELTGLYRARVLTAHKADGRWAQSGDRSFEQHRARTARSSPGAARAETALGEGLAALPQAADAVHDGQMSLGHAGVLTRMHAEASESVKRALTSGSGLDHLLDVAAEVDVPTFAKRVRAWAAGVDEAQAESTFEAVRRRRYHRVVDKDGGTRIDAFVDPVVGATWRAALEALTPVPGVDDDRSSEQRAADALAAMAARVLDQGSDKIGAQIRPHISLVVPAETWATMRARRRGRRDSDESRVPAGVGPRRRADDQPPESVGPATSRARRVVLPELDDGTVVTPSELERIACDCEMTRIVLDAQGVPLDVGRTERTYSKELRRAILVRDGHCQWPGCTIRASWCEVHHRQWFSLGGTTSAENAITLCVFHHHEVHRRRIHIQPIDRGHRFIAADGRPIGTTTRDRGVLRLLTPNRVDGDRAEARGVPIDPQVGDGLPLALDGL